MNCGDARDQLPDFVTDRLEAELRAPIDRHLGACLACRTFRADLDAFYRESFALPPADPTPVLELRTPRAWPGRAAVAATLFGLVAWAVVAIEFGPGGFGIDPAERTARSRDGSANSDVTWSPVVFEALPMPTWNGRAYSKDFDDARRLALLCDQPLIEIEVATGTDELDRVDALFAPPEIDELFGYFLISVAEVESTSTTSTPLATPRVRFRFDEYSSGWQEDALSIARIFSLIEAWKRAQPEQYWGAVGLVTRPQLEQAIERIRQGDQALAEGRVGAAWSSYDSARLGLPEGHGLEKRLRERLSRIEAALESDLERVESSMSSIPGAKAKLLHRVSGHPHFEERVRRL